MKHFSVLFVDDEEDICFTFRDRFEDRLHVYTANSGKEALNILRGNNDIHVAVTDIRMPLLNGLELIEQARDIAPDIGFIVVSGHAESDEIISALRLGARNFIRKPYDFSELESVIYMEANRYRLIKEERREREREKAIEQFLVGIDRMKFMIPNNLEWVNHLAFRLARHMVSVGVCKEDSMVNVALGMIEIITNAIEHGNLGITSQEKIQLKGRGENVYQDEIKRREADPKYKNRFVKITSTIQKDQALVEIEDEGNGFDVNALLDPTAMENLFATSGRGILLARTFLDEVNFNPKGNKVSLVIRKSP
ncbi:MAG: response regulator [Deltaproteobacteria bacterium]|nr:response regulator [Deltaproteobacteria bacterium]